MLYENYTQSEKYKVKKLNIYQPEVAYILCFARVCESSSTNSITIQWSASMIY